MANEVATTKPKFSVVLTEELNMQRDALPRDLNITRFVNNSIALLNGNETLAAFAKKYGTEQIKMGLIRGAYLGLDAMNNEMYLVPYGSTINFMPSYVGMQKLCVKYSTRPIKTIYAKVVREGDEFEETIVNGEPSITFKPKAFNNGKTLESEGPTLRAAVRGQNHTAALFFDHAEGLTGTRGFELAGHDGLFHPATIQIEGDKILLSSPSVALPAYVRYGWQGFTDADLHNAAGLPASTFYQKIE